MATTQPTSKSKKYVVKKGDSLNKIAKSFGFANYKKAGITGYGKNPDFIRPGQVLSIGGGSSPVSSKSSLGVPSGSKGYYSRTTAADTSALNSTLGDGSNVGTTPGVDSGIGSNQAPQKEYFSRINDRESQLRDIVTDPGKAPSYEDIRRQMQGANQALIDQIKNEYRSTIADERVQGNLRNDRQRASNVTSGLTGSDFATSAASEVEGKNLEVIRQYERERDSKIATILAGVEQRATDQYEKARNQYRSDAESSLGKYKEFRESALEDAKNLSSAGITADTLKKESPDTWNQLLKQTGYTDVGLTAYFTSSRPEKDKVFSEKIGNNYVVGYRDPVTGKISTEKVEIADGFTDFENIGGKPYFVNYDTGEIKLATGYQPSTSSSSSKAPSLFDSSSTEKYYKTLPLEFRKSWEYNYGEWGNPAYRTTFDDLKKDYTEWSKQNPYKKSGSSSTASGGVSDL